LKNAFVITGRRVRLLFVIIFLLLCCSFCSGYKGFDVTFTSKFTADQTTCDGGMNQVNAGVVELLVRKGRSCEDSSGWFYEVVCNNSGDLLKTIPPGSWIDVNCVLDSSPFEDDAPNCLMVEWCGQKATIDLDKTKCKEGECNCDAAKPEEMTCCAGGKMSSADSKTFCGKCSQNPWCSKLLIQSAPADNCAGDKSKCKMSLLFIPVDWEHGTYDSFVVKADRQFDNFIDSVGLSGCPGYVEKKVVLENCKVGISKDHTECTLNFIGYGLSIQKCVDALGESADYVVAITSDNDACGANILGKVTYNLPVIGNNKILMKTSSAQYTLAHELGHKMASLNDEYFDACRCSVSGVFGPNCLDKELNGDEAYFGDPPNAVIRSSDNCGGGDECHPVGTEDDPFCLGNKNPEGGRCIMASGTDNTAFCTHCREALDATPKLTCPGGAKNQDGKTFQSGSFANPKGEPLGAGEGAALSVELTRGKDSCEGDYPMRWEIDGTDYSAQCSEKDYTSNMVGLNTIEMLTMKCSSDKLPSFSSGPHKVKVSWCVYSMSFEYGGDYEKLVLTCDEGLCNCAAAKPEEMTCCSGGKMIPADSKTFCGKCGANKLCSGLTLKSAPEGSKAVLEAVVKDPAGLTVAQGASVDAYKGEKLYLDYFSKSTIDWDECDPSKKNTISLIYAKGSLIKKVFSMDIPCNSISDSFNLDTQGTYLATAEIWMKGASSPLIAKATINYNDIARTRPRVVLDVNVAVVDGDNGFLTGQGSSLDGTPVDVYSMKNEFIFFDPTRSSVAPEDIKSWQLDYGTNIPPEEFSPPLQNTRGLMYPESGSYPVTLTITLKSGEVLRATVTINLKERPACKSIISKGSDADKLDIVFIPSTGFKDVDEFEGIINEYYQNLIGTKPFDGYADKINIWAVYLPLKCEADKNGDLACSAGTDAESICPHDKIVYLIKEVTGRSLITIDRAFVKYDPTDMNIFVHELAHTLTADNLQIGDEYLDDESAPLVSDQRVINSPNCDIDSSCSKWAKLVDDGYGARLVRLFTGEPVPGCVQGCYYSKKYYRSAENCIMNDERATDSFCPVCTDYLEEYFAKEKYKVKSPET
jgi:hypothetical protein